MKSGNCREPDVAFIQSHRISTSDRTQPSNGADLVMEVVSPDPRDRDRDYHEKRNEYAASGIPEYWIVDPQPQTVTVLMLANGQYAEHGVFGIGDMASSVLLPNFSISVADTFAAANLP